MNFPLHQKYLDTILVLDFGSQYTQLIASRIRELDVFSVILPWDISKVLKNITLVELFSLVAQNLLHRKTHLEFLKLSLT